MEEASFRFPHIPEQILKRLDNASLTKCRLVSHSWQYMIDSQKEFCIQKFQKQTNCSFDLAKNIVKRMNTKKLISLGQEIHQDYNDKNPMHSAAKNGHALGKSNF